MSDDNTKYSEVGVEPWTDCEEHWEGNRLSITGTCSRCHHRTTRDFGIITVTGSGGGAGGAGGDNLSEIRKGETRRDQNKPETVLCDCGREHEGREPDTHPSGCGARWFGTIRDGEA